MSAIEPLPRRSAVDELAAALRTRILDGDLGAGERLREQELTDVYDVARHTVRAALRVLAAEGLVKIEPNRGAHVARLGRADVEGLFELRTALEVEAARLALQRHDGTLPQTVHDAAAKLTRVCHRKAPRWGDVIDAHDALHAALVAASGAPRIIRAHDALAAETRLFMVQLRPGWSLRYMAEDHERLVQRLQDQGPDALRPHLRESADAVIALLR